jgi:hypothetical protein
VLQKYFKPRAWNFGGKAFPRLNFSKSLSLNNLLRLNPPLKKGEIGGFALARLGEIPPTPLYKGGNIIYGQALSLITTLIIQDFLQPVYPTVH